MGIKKNFGFTLIEMILVIAVIGLTLPSLVNIVLTVVRQQIKIVALQEIKSQGDDVLRNIQTVVRSNAIGIYSDSGLLTSECSDSLVKNEYGPNDGSAFFFKDKNGDYFRYYYNSVSLADRYIASQSATMNVRLTNTRVLISDFSVSCKRLATYSAPIVAISFTVSHKNGASMNYQTRIKLRNY